MCFGLSRSKSRLGGWARFRLPAICRVSRDSELELELEPKLGRGLGWLAAGLLERGEPVGELGRGGGGDAMGPALGADEAAVGAPVPEVITMAVKLHRR
jgi:hypothetical protein